MMDMAEIAAMVFKLREADVPFLRRVIPIYETRRRIRDAADMLEAIPAKLAASEAARVEAEARNPLSAAVMLERAAMLVEDNSYTIGPKGERKLAPVSPVMKGMDQHHATIAASIRALSPEINEADLDAAALERPKVRALVTQLAAWLEIASHCSITEGVCCCGDNMEGHAEPMDCGHSPVDHGGYHAEGLMVSTEAALTALKVNP